MTLDLNPWEIDQLYSALCNEIAKYAAAADNRRSSSAYRQENLAIAEKLRALRDRFDNAPPDDEEQAPASAAIAAYENYYSRKGEED
jgi:hypothetical protein